MAQRPTTLAGASGQVVVRRNASGVPEVSAACLDDALLGLGYCHAQDRGLQLLFVRIIGRGEASRWFQASDELLRLDTFFRRLGFRADEVEQEQALSDRARSGMEAYCRGVNLGFQRFGVPWELRALGFRLGSDPWRFADLALIGKVVGYVQLAVSQAEVERWIVECLQHGVSVGQLEELFPGRLGGLDEGLLRQVRLGARVIPDELWKIRGLPLAAASNNWAVAGTRTDSGRPFLCSDPHLQINRLPAVWYEAVLRWSQPEGTPRYAIGATMPGTPGVVIGRTPDLAWGVTYAYMDCTDSWVEECRDGQYRRGDRWRPFRVRQETIARKGKPPVTVHFFENEHGTLDGDPHQPGFYLATRWACGEQTSADSLDAILSILDARTVEEGRRHLARLRNSAWNWVLADRAGAIGYQMSGQMPLRRPGASGLVPLPGWDPENDWRGFATAEDLPRALNPAEGVLATANDDLNDLGKVRPINVCIAPYRASRIRAVLARHGRFTLEEMKALQLDLYSIQAERFMTHLKPLLATIGLSGNAAILHDWDLCYRADSRGATLFERFYRILIEHVFAGRAGPRDDSARPTAIPGPALAHLLDETTMLADLADAFDRVLLSESSLWFGGRSRSEVYREALAQALEGDAPPYGATRKFVLAHLLLGGKLPRRLGFDRGPYTLPGSRATVFQGQLLRHWGRTVASGPSYRFVTDLGTDEAHTSLPGGPSDRRFSRWYASGLAGWLNGLYQTLRGRAGPAALDTEPLRCANLDPSCSREIPGDG